MAQPPSPAQPNSQRPRLGEMLIREGLISNEQLGRALEEQKAFGGRLGRHLVDLGFIGDEVLLDSLSRQLRIPRIDIEAPGVIASDASRYARADLAEQWGFCPITFDPKRNTLLIAVSDPDPQLLADIESFLAMKVEPRIASADAIERVQRRLFHGDGTPVKRMQGLQIARAETRNVGMNDGLGLNAPPAPAAPMPAPVAAPPPPPQVNPFEAQIAQQVAMQAQLQQQLQQQLQMQQLQLHAAQQAPFNPAMGQMPPNVMPPPGMPPAGMPNGMPGPNGMAGFGGYNGQPPQPYPGYPPAPPKPPMPNGAMPMANGTQLRPPAPPMVAPIATPVPGPNGGASLEALQDQLNRLEKTLAAQARALRSLVEVLVEKGVLTKMEMARKQQMNNK